ncbi:MAG: AAA family ATPase, partial [Candidatus Aenigmarchaeota archaeon]|nr:AAA family ATPase [Candidatus Aenigmarchaeota archaeon]
MNPQIFISYSSEDKITAETVCQKLEASGVKCWIAPRDVTPGKDYAEEIVNGIDNSQAMVLVLTKSSNESHHVKREVERAVSKGMPIIPFMAEHVKLSKAMEYFISSHHWLMAVEPPLEKHLPQLVETVKNALTEKELIPAFTKTKTEGEKRIVTAMSLGLVLPEEPSRKLDLEDLSDIKNNCFRILSDTVNKYEGKVDKIAGDAMMSIFGYPVLHEDDPERAVRCAIDMMSAINSPLLRGEQGVCKSRGARGVLSLQIGLNSGWVIAGAAGSDGQAEYAVMGDAINFASLLREKAKIGQILVGENTYDSVKHVFDFKSLKSIQAKGKKEKIKIYQATGVKEAVAKIKGRRPVRVYTALVGRDNEIVALKDVVNKVQMGQGQILSIVGEAGIGKSRLVYELKNIIKDSEFNYIESSCFSYGTIIPYFLFLDVIKSILQIAEKDAEPEIKQKAEKGIKDIDPALMDDIPFIEELLLLQSSAKDSATTMEKKQQQQQTNLAVRRLILGKAKDKPLVLILEDLHWIDPSSHQFLNSLGIAIKNKKILLGCVYRPEFKHDLTNCEYYRQINLTGLSEDSVEKMAEGLWGSANLPESVKRLVIEKSDGNPLFVEELVKMLVEKGAIKKVNGSYQAVAEIDNISVPGTIQGILMSRINRLEKDLKLTLQYASVIGGEFHYKLLRLISEMEEQLPKYLDELQNLEFVYEKSAIPELEYAFKHILTQQAAYQSLLKKKRQEFHRKVAETMEELYKDKLWEKYEPLAHHYSESDNLAKAVEYLQKAGDKVGIRWWGRESSPLEFYSRALEILGGFEDNIENKKMKAHLLLRKGAALPIDYREPTYYDTDMSWGRINHTPDVEKVREQKQI